MSGFTAADVPSQLGRRVLVTGANTGIGFEAAKVLAGKGARVILACRDLSRAHAAVDRIRAEHPQALLDVLQLDLADLASIRAAAEAVEHIEVLINNAGIMRPPLGHTRDGFELQFGINHLGHFALAGRLLTKLTGTDPRVVTVASIAHRQGKIAFDNLDGRKSYSRGRFYAQSKLANLLFVAELDRRLRAAGSPVKSVGCHPGVAGTDLGRHGTLDRLGIGLAGRLLNTAEEGAWPTLQAATAPTVQSGDYYGPQGFLEMRGQSGHASRTKRAWDADIARRLWDVSVELTGVDPGLNGGLPQA